MIEIHYHYVCDHCGERQPEAATVMIEPGDRVPWPKWPAGWGRFDLPVKRGTYAKLLCFDCVEAAVVGLKVRVDDSLAVG